MLASIDWGAVGQLLWAAPVAGVAVAVTFAVLILGAARAGDARREGAGGAAVAFSVLTVLAGAGFAGVVVYALDVITTK